MKRLLSFLLAALLAIPAFAEPNGTCNFKSGTPTCIAFSGYVFNLGTQSTQRLNFLTNNTVRGYIDGTTGVWTGLTLGATSMGELTLSGALKIPNATAISALNQAGDTYIPLLLLNTNNTTLLQSGVGEEMQIRIGADANRRFDFSAASDTAHVLKFGDDGGTAVQNFTISASTLDADDDSTLFLAGGGAVASDGTRGAYITLPGEEVSGGADILYNAGASDTHSFAIAGTGIATIAGTGILPASDGSASTSVLGSSSLGWKQLHMSDSFNNDAYLLASTGFYLSYPSGQSLFFREAGTDKWSIKATSGDFAAVSSGNTLALQEATAGSACMGTLTANGATPVVTSTTCATTGSRIFLSRTSAETGAVQAWISAISTGVSFSVTGEAADTGSYNWIIFHEAP